MKQDKLVLGVTTYNRVDYLQHLLDTFQATRDAGLDWLVVVADDGSKDGTLEYLSTKMFPFPVEVLSNNRRGVHHQKNQILRYLSEREFDVCFMCDDDIFFHRPGWERLYMDAMKTSGYQHLVYGNLQYRPELKSAPVEKPPLYCRANIGFIQGALYTITPEIIQTVGYMDLLNFGLGLGGHVDYSWRCCRAGFNDAKTPFDAMNSNDYIGMHVGKGHYKPAIEYNLRQQHEGDADALAHKRRVMAEHRIYIAYNEIERTWDDVAGGVPMTYPGHQKHGGESKKINVGCGKNVKKGYLNIDKYVKAPGIINCDADQLPAKDGEMDEVLAEDVLEHFPWTEWQKPVREWVRVLAPGGKLIIRVPDMRALGDALMSASNNPALWLGVIRRVYGAQNENGGRGEGMFHYGGFSMAYLRSELESKFGLTYVEHGTNNLNLTLVMQK